VSPSERTQQGLTGRALSINYFKHRRESRQDIDTIPGIETYSYRGSACSLIHTPVGEFLPEIESQCASGGPVQSVSRLFRIVPLPYFPSCARRFLNRYYPQYSRGRDAVSIESYSNLRVTYY